MTILQTVSPCACDYCDAPDFIPTATQEAEALGYRLVIEGEDPEPPADMPFDLMVAFYRGILAARPEGGAR